MTTEFTAPTQAPKGGAMSPLNGEFYKGGQFMCNQFDMPKGYTKHLKRAAAKRGSKSENIADVTVTDARVLVRMAGDDREECVFSGDRRQCAEFARQLIAAKVDMCLRSGFAPHPTNLIVR